MDCSLLGFIHGILQARILEWVAISPSKASSRPGAETRSPAIAGSFFTVWASGPRSRPPSLQEASKTAQTISLFFLPSSPFSRISLSVFQLPPLNIPSSPEGRCQSLTLLDQVPLYSQPQRACPLLCLQAFGRIQEHVIATFLFSPARNLGGILPNTSVITFHFTDVSSPTFKLGWCFGLKKWGPLPSLSSATTR